MPAGARSRSRLASGDRSGTWSGSPRRRRAGRAGEHVRGGVRVPDPDTAFEPDPSFYAYLHEPAQREVSAAGGGFAARQDVKATDAHATALAALMKGVDVFGPGWKDIGKNLPGHLDAWRKATGS
ncbi:hypothetical protein [Streptomyces sp. NPDC014733]|uniref:hypothetical protein n=1 Tax=Streptomyces sp. NPDC014733 TaxID=3364885 RepID=UPI0036FD1209